MRRRGRGATAIASNPVLVGAATTLVIVVAIFLAYNANAGLPWVPSYKLTAEIPAATSLVKGNEVRIGGARVGVVDEIEPNQNPDGSVSATVGLKLETDVKPLPVDSTLMIRARSALGLKYVEVRKGTSQRGFAEGATIPITSQTDTPVEFDDFFNMFDARTRVGSRQNLRGFGDGFAGRGDDINLAIQLFRPLVRDAVPVLANIADPRTRFNRFFASQARAAEIVAPVALQQAELWVNLDATLTAFADISRPYLQETITKGPEALDTAIETLPKIRPFLASSADFFETLQPGAAALNNSAEDLAIGFTEGVPALKASPGFNRRLGSFLEEFQDFATDPIVPIGFRDLIGTVQALDPTVRFVAPAQTVCNYLGLVLNRAAGLLSDGDNIGTWLRFMVIASPVGTDGGPAPNGEGGPSSATANGGGLPVDDIDPNYLHVNPYPNTASPGQTPFECEAGNGGYVPGRQVIGNVPGNQGTETADQVK